MRIVIDKNYHSNGYKLFELRKKLTEMAMANQSFMSVLKSKYRKVFEKDGLLVIEDENGFFSFSIDGGKRFSQPFKKVFNFQVAGWPLRVWDRIDFDCKFTQFVIVKDPNDKFGIFDLKSFEFSTPCIYDDVDFSNINGGVDERGFIRVCINNLWGYVYMGVEVMKPAFDSISPTIFTDESENPYLISAKKGGKYGYVNIHGVTKIPFRYDYADDFDFATKLAVVGFETDYHNFSQSSNIYLEINTKGEVVEHIK